MAKGKKIEPEKGQKTVEFPLVFQYFLIFQHGKKRNETAQLKIK